MLKVGFSAKSNRLSSVQFSFDPTVPARQLARAAMLQGRATPGMAGMMAGMLGMGGVDVSSLMGGTKAAAGAAAAGAETATAGAEMATAAATTATTVAPSAAVRRYGVVLLILRHCFFFTSCS